MTDPIILVPEQISERERQAIIEPLGEFSEARGFAFRPRAVGLVLRAADAIVRGLLGDTNWDRLTVARVLSASRLPGVGRLPSYPGAEQRMFLMKTLSP